jgi:hypothetical protein
LWRDRRDIAERLYGHISDWDVSRVTDMSELFKSDGGFFGEEDEGDPEDDTHFDENLSRWQRDKYERDVL